MRIYTLPDFNVTVDMYRPPNTFPGVPDATFQAQFYLYSRAAYLEFFDTDGRTIIPIMLRVPVGTDLRIFDVLDIPAGSGQFYRAMFVERTHLGFPNEYLTAVLFQVVPPTTPAVIPVGGLSSLVPAANVGYVNGYTPNLANLICTVVSFDAVGAAFGIPLLGVTPMAIQAQIGPIVAAGISMTVVVGTVTIPVGAFSTQAIAIGGTALMHVATCVSSGIPIGNDTNGTGSGFAAPATFATGAANIRIPEEYVGAFGLINPVGANTWAAPMAILNADLQDNLAGQVCRSTQGGMLSLALAVQNFAVAPVNPAAWAGAGCSVG